MSILIGLKSEHAHGSFHGAEGFEGFSIDTNSMVVIKEGTKDELLEYVKKMRDGMDTARKAMDKLEDELEYSNKTQEEYEREYDELSQKLSLKKYKKLMIIEGEII